MLTCGSVAAVFVLAMFVPEAFGQPVANGITDQYRTASLVWATRLTQSARRVFVLLAAFEVVASAMILLMKPKKLDDAAGGFVIKMMVMSLCFLGITGFEMVIPPLFETFVQAGKDAAFVPTLNPSQIAGIGILISGAMLAGGVLGSLGTNIVLLALTAVCALLVALAFAAIACQVVYTLVEGYVVMSAGVFFLGFASFRGTATLADNYIMYVVHVGIKLFILYLIVPIGITVAKTWPLALLRAGFMDLQAGLEVLIGACIFCGLVLFLPGTFASRITSGANLGIAQALRSN